MLLPSKSISFVFSKHIFRTPIYIQIASWFIYKSQPDDIQIAERLRSNHSAIKHQWEYDYIIITFFPLMI